MKWKEIGISLSIFLATLLFGILPAHALTISPPLYDLGVTPGQSITDSLKVFNETSQTGTWYLETQNFTSQGVDGSPSFAGENNTEDLASWIVLPSQSVTLTPGQSVDLNFTINVPENADAGGHYAAIFLDSSPPSAGAGAVGVSSRIGTLILLRVAGDIIESGSLQSFTPDAGVHASLPVGFDVLFKNSGNVHVKPYGAITIHNLSGAMVASVLVNQAQQPDGTIGSVGNVLPKSSREFDEFWGTAPTSSLGFWSAVSYEWQNFALGRYTADLHLVYGTKGETINSSLAFWVIPWQLLLTILVALVILIFLVVFVIRRYNAWIINKAAAQR